MRCVESMSLPQEAYKKGGMIMKGEGLSHDDTCGENDKMKMKIREQKVRSGIRYNNG